MPSDGPPTDPPLPILANATFDEAMLRQYVADLALAAEVLEGRVKSAPSAPAAATPLSAEAAVGLLLAGAARAAHVRYRYDGYEWVDTIAAGPEGYRVVRCRFESSPRSLTGAGR